LKVKYRLSVHKYRTTQFCSVPRHNPLNVQLRLQM